MYRSSDNHHEYSDLNDDNEESFNKSYNSAQSMASTANGASSSKAVLAALRALQDKIRRLEAERSQALDESVQLRHQLKNQEIESDHIKQKENLTAQKALHEVRHSYDRLLAEKTELETRLSRLEDKNRTSQNTSEELQSKIRSLEEQKHSSSLQIKELEHQQSQIDMQIKHAQQKEKEMAQTMVWETKRHEDDISTLHRKVQSLQSELLQSCQEKGHTDSKLLELDQLVSQLLTVNESLVSQLSGKPSKGLGSSSPIKKVVKKSTKKTIVPRAASAGTAASEANKISKFATRQHSQLIPVKSEDIEQLRSMHKMYANMARSISRGDSAGRSSSSKKGKSSGAASDVSVSSAKSSGSVGGSGRKSGAGTRLSRKKAQLIERFSENARMSQSYESGHNGSSVDVRLPKPSIAFDNSRLDDSIDFDAQHDSTKDQRDQQDFHEYMQNRTSPSVMSTPVLGGSSSSRSNPSSILKSNTSYAGSGSQRRAESVSKAEIQGVISSLEDEFEALNLQYKRLLNNVQTPAAISGDLVMNGEQNIQAQAEEIVAVIQKLHKKGEQLRSLKSP